MLDVLQLFSPLVWKMLLTFFSPKMRGGAFETVIHFVFTSHDSSAYVKMPPAIEVNLQPCNQCIEIRLPMPWSLHNSTKFLHGLLCYAKFPAAFRGNGVALITLQATEGFWPWGTQRREHRWNPASLATRAANFLLNSTTQFPCEV